MSLQIHPRTIVINVITTFALALIFEALITFGLKSPHVIPGLLKPYFQKYYLSQDRSIIQVTSCAQYDPELFYMLKEGSCAFTNREFDVMNHVNALGLRDDKESLEKPAVVVFGDSFTLGWGIEQEATYPQVLEEMLNKKVLNAGMSSFGTARETILMKRLDLSGVEKIVIQYHPNDFEENTQYIQDGFHLKVRTPQSYDSLKKAITGRTDYYLFKHLAGVSKSFAHQLVRKEEKTVSDTLQAYKFLQIVKHSRLAEAADELIVFKIDKYGANTDGFENAVDHWLTLPEFSGMKIKTARISTPLSREDYFILDDHINARGHSKLASRLYEYFNNDPSPVFVETSPGN